MNLVEQIVDIAEHIEMGDPIDWGMLQINERDAYNTIALGVLENYLAGDRDDRDMILLATTVKLLVENFVLNLKLMESINQRNLL